MLRVAVAGLVEAPLPAAEVAQCEPTVVRHLWAPAFLFHYEYFYHHEVDGVSDAWVLVDSGRHCHHCEDVVLPGSGEQWENTNHAPVLDDPMLPPPIRRHLSHTCQTLG